MPKPKGGRIFPDEYYPSNHVSHVPRNHPYPDCWRR